ncbi:hypothetical protein HU200_048861 [Digitaria exilis]|uniref:Uncharacterized protein n=1 Tax=Digitaria exilis TaxID=1010633 RepID=A0A835AVT7_9POAL|nr:hypothetical protein HU200_048861 [Digitaria exilis]
MDLVTLINKKDPEEAGRKEEGTEKGQKSSIQGNDEIEEVENHSNVQQKVNEDHLQVISVLGTGSDLEMVAIEKAHHDSETCKSFEHWAWGLRIRWREPLETGRAATEAGAIAAISIEGGGRDGGGLEGRPHRQDGSWRVAAGGTMEARVRREERKKIRFVL